MGHTSPLHYIDFDESMKTAQFQHVINDHRTLRDVGAPGQDVLQFFRTLYEKNNFNKVALATTPRIPKIIHQIWVGTGVPEELKAFQESCKFFHPDWEYRLWTQDDIPALNMRNANSLPLCINNAQVADLMRYEILYKYGGVYLDMDMECFANLDQLHYAYDLYVGIQPLDSDIVQLGVGILGAKAGHPMLKHCIELIGERCLSGDRDNNHRAGPLPFTTSFLHMANRGPEINIALPAHYFYPQGCLETNLDYDQWLEQGAFAIHHWAKTWLLPAFRRPQFRTIKNY
jgi:hypothetical protein